MSKRYLKLENCPMLETPKVNTVVWSQQKQESRNVDANIQNGQGYLMSAVYALLEMFNKVAENHDNEIITTLTHVIVLALSATGR